MVTKDCTCEEECDCIQSLPHLLEMVDPDNPGMNYIIRCYGACSTLQLSYKWRKSNSCPISDHHNMKMEMYSCLFHSCLLLLLLQKASFKLASHYVLCLLARDSRSKAGHSGVMSFVAVSSSCNKQYLQIHSIRLAAPILIFTVVAWHYLTFMFLPCMVSEFEYGPMQSTTCFVII